jgi:hypothetical protein
MKGIFVKDELLQRIAHAVTQAKETGIKDAAAKLGNAVLEPAGSKIVAEDGKGLRS